MNGRLSNPSSGANASEEAADANLPEPITSREAPCEIIFSEGDIILNCIPAPSSPGPHRPASRFRTTSTTLKTASDYFKVLLDPAKFQEGRQFLETIDALRVQYGSVELALRRAEIDELPQVTLELPPISSRVNQVALLGDFLRLLADSPFTNTAVPETIAKKPISFLASLAALLDRYGARHILNQALKAHEPGDDSLKLADGASERQRLRHRLQTFRSDDEERVREAIFLAQCLRDSKAFGLLTHKLVVSGSREWAQGFDERQAGIDRPIWWQLSGSVEEELRYRNQCILDTVSDYQSHLLCAYGASTCISGDAAISQSTGRRELQCRRAYENSRACDSFHLGEMIHFFTTRARTLELRSALAHHESESDDENENVHGNGNVPSRPASSRLPTNITAVIAALRQCPEYQVDSNHVGCGIRRRLIGALDCIEGFTRSRDVTGICLRHCDLSSGLGSWSNETFRNTLSVCVRGSSVQSVTFNYGVPGAIRCGDNPYTCNCISKGQTARALFTTKHRKWE